MTNGNAHAKRWNFLFMLWKYRDMGVDGFGEFSAPATTANRTADQFVAVSVKIVERHTPAPNSKIFEFHERNRYRGFRPNDG
ncbi:MULTISPECIES: hypothetical protein [Burkholderiaceae]|uniref:hypothetical protein n=1 Tax=Burkholderiaceae TaxID=119060 RepID=UPI001587CFBF|nr:hypothetical protein [Ralstonia sp. 25mfcol4.1]